MTWYKTGTVAVTPGSNAVIGAGTSFISNSRVGDAFRGPDGEWYEVTNIASDAALSIAPGYQGAAVTAGAYSLAPMQGYVKDSADALRAATQVIASGVADMQEQVAAATEAATSAGQSKALATEQAGIATTAAGVSTDSKDAAQLAAQQGQGSAQASGAAAARSEAARDSIIQSEQAAAASAEAAAESAARAEEVTVGKAASGANSDITSLSALTTALSVEQGGTGSKNPSNARSALGLKSASTAELMTSLSDPTAGRVMVVGAFGTGGTAGVRLPGDDANAVVPNGNYCTPAVWTGSPYAGADSKNQGFLETRTWSTSGDAIQVWRGIIPAYGIFTRFKTEGVWGSWTNSSAADIAFTYVYPNGGSAASPASVSIGSRYASPNPFPGFPIICHVELLISGVWETPGWFSNGQSGGSGTLSTPRRGGAVDEIITATGGIGVASGSAFGGGSYNSSTLTSAPARIKVWRVKG